jgi:adenylate cyclase
MEIERKFLVTSFPKPISTQEITQYYIVTNENEEIRVRQMTEGNKTQYFITIKRGTGMEREEKEYPIKEDVFNQLMSFAIGEIKKTRHVITEGRYGISVDEFKGKLEGLKIAELEFKTTKEARDFVPPDWFGEEVTYKENYKNKNLATLGLP